MFCDGVYSEIGFDMEGRYQSESADDDSALIQMLWWLVFPHPDP